MKKNFILIAIVFIIAFNISLFNAYQNVTTSLIALGISLPWLYLLFKRFTADTKRTEKKTVETTVIKKNESTGPAPTFSEIMFQDKIDLILVILILASFGLSYFLRQYEFHMLIVCAIFAVIKLVRDKKFKK